MKFSLAPDFKIEENNPNILCESINGHLDLCPEEFGNTASVEQSQMSNIAED